MKQIESKRNVILSFSGLLLISTILISACGSKRTPEKATKNIVADSISFTYSEVSGIGLDSLANRRDNSDVLKVGNVYYVYYSKMESPVTAGYWATIWYATSIDEGHTWQEQGMALGLGEKGTFDSHSVFTPNILAFKGKYFLYYTGVQPTKGNANNVFENNSINDFTAIGVAVADSPDGPFVRIDNNPVLKVSNVPEDFDSYRIDDAAILVKDSKIWLYYKGRSIIHGNKGPGLTKMGVAFSDKPEGPFEKYPEPLIDKSHEVLIWNQNGGIASLACLSKTLYLANDGINFSSLQDNLTDLPKAPGLYRPHLEDGNSAEEIPGWGMAMKSKKGVAYLVRFEMNN